MSPLHVCLALLPTPPTSFCSRVMHSGELTAQWRCTDSPTGMACIVAICDCTIQVTITLGPAHVLVAVLRCYLHKTWCFLLLYRRVLPPVSKLRLDQALYHLISGYTAKVAGEELGGLCRGLRPAFS